LHVKRTKTVRAFGFLWALAFAVVLRAPARDALAAEPAAELRALVEQLRVKDLREDASARLTARGREAVPVLIEALEDRNRHVREKAASILGEIGDVSCFDALARAAPQEPLWISFEAMVRSLLRIAPDRAVPLLMQWTGNGSGRGEIASKILIESGTVPIAALVDALADPKGAFRWSACQELARRDDPEIVNLLQKALLDPRTRQPAACLLGEKRCPCAIPYLIEDMINATRQYEESVAEVESHVFNRDAYLHMVKGLRNGDGYVHYELEKEAFRGTYRAPDGFWYELRDRDFNGRSGYLIRIGSLSVPALLPLLESESPLLRSSAALALQRIGGEEVAPAMDRLWRTDPDPRCRLAAAGFLALERKDPEAFRHLLTILEAKDAFLRSQAIYFLGRCGNEEALPHLARAFERTRHLLESQAAQRAMAAFGAKAVPYLHRILGNLDAPRERTLLTLDGIATVESIPFIVPCLYDDSVYTVHAAVKALGSIGLVAFDPLLSAFRSSPRRRKWGLIDAMLEIDASMAIPVLAELLDDPKKDTRACAARMLGGTGNSAAAPFLDRHLEGKNVTADGLRAVAHLEGARAVSWFVRFLSHHDADVRLAAAGCLGENGNRCFAGPLLTLLADPDYRVRWAAVEALREIGDPGSLRPLICCLNDSDCTVRSYAVMALEELTNQRFGEDAPAWNRWLAESGR
jgi:HEAT repeat protein